MKTYKITQMKTNYLVLIIAVLTFMPNLTLAQLNQKSLDYKGREILLGKIDKNGLTNNSFAKWFKPNHEAYTVAEFETQNLKKKLKEYKITVFMGTWCGDSKREVPRFYKILEKLQFPTSQLTVVGVDNHRERYKKSPTGEEKGLNIIKVPTFIFYKNGKEVNRIVESPIVSLEKDIETILNDKDYKHKYDTE